LQITGSKNQFFILLTEQQQQIYPVFCPLTHGSGRYLQAAAGKLLDEAMQRGVFYIFREDNIGHQTHPGFGATQGNCLGGGLYNGALAGIPSTMSINSSHASEIPLLVSVFSFGSS